MSDQSKIPATAGKLRGETATNKFPRPLTFEADGTDCDAMLPPNPATDEQEEQEDIDLGRVPPDLGCKPATGECRLAEWISGSCSQGTKHCLVNHDQPRPATGNQHPRAERDQHPRPPEPQPQPASGEWTAQRIVQFLGLHSKHTEAASFLADAINAALAEQKQDLWQNISCARIEADNWKGLYEKSQEQLAAEQELNANMASALKQAQIQLAAERERIKVLESGTGLNAVIVTNQHLRKQLADERENYVAQREDWIKEIQELQKQLAAEKDALDTVAKDRDRRAMLLDETVLCLNTVRSFIEHDIQLCAIIDIALAKVKP